MTYWDYLRDNASSLAFDSYQHVSYVVQSLVIGVIVAILIAVLTFRRPALVGLANSMSAIGLTIPSLALFGILVALMGPEIEPSVIALSFYGAMPVLRNALVGLTTVDETLVESARAMGMSPFTVLVRLRLPMAWPVIMTGVRVSAQMMMGVAAIAAYISGPGLGGYIFSGLSRIGGANATESVVVATVLIVLLAVVLDLVLGLVGRVTTSRGIRV